MIQHRVGDRVWLHISAAKGRAIVKPFYYGPAPLSWLPMIIESISLGDPDKDNSSGMFMLDPQGWDSSFKIKANLSIILPRSAPKAGQELGIASHSMWRITSINEAETLEYCFRRFLSGSTVSYVLSKQCCLYITPAVRISENVGNNRLLNGENMNAPVPIKALEISMARLNKFSLANNEDESSFLAIFSITARLLDAVRESKKNQSIILRGCSGSGKTEAVKAICQYIILQNSNLFSSATTPLAANVDIFQPLGSINNPFYIPSYPRQSSQRAAEALACGLLILDNFGSAATKSHLNSSRHLKAIKLGFDDLGIFCSVKFDCLLLDMTKVSLRDASFSSASSLIRPLKIFSLVAAAISERADEFSMTTKQRNSCMAWMTQSLSDTSLEAAHLYRSLQFIGFTDAQWDGLLKAVLAIIHLQSLVIMGSDSSTISQTSKALVANAEVCLSLEPGSLAAILLTQQTSTELLEGAGKAVEAETHKPSSMFEKKKLGPKEFKPEEVKQGIDVLSFEIMNRLMNYLLTCCEKHCQRSDHGKGGDRTSYTSSLDQDYDDAGLVSFINIIDPPGFDYEPTVEDADDNGEGGSRRQSTVSSFGGKNGLQQLVQALVEERLRALTIQDCMEQQILLSVEEGVYSINSETKANPDYAAFVDLLEAPGTGICQVIDESSAAAPSNKTNDEMDKSLLDKFLLLHAKSRLLKIGSDVSAASTATSSAGRGVGVGAKSAVMDKLFALTHSWGIGTYNAAGMLAANKAEFPSAFSHILNMSSIDALHDHPFSSVMSSSSSSSPTTTGMRKSMKGYLRTQLELWHSLLDGVLQSNEHGACETTFIHCIRLNADLLASQNERSFHFDSPYIMGQLSALSIPAFAFLNSQLFPVKYMYREYYDRYRPCLPFNSSDEAFPKIFPVSLMHSSNNAAAIDLSRRLLQACLAAACLPLDIIDRTSSDAQVAFGKTHIMFHNELNDSLESMRSSILHRKKLAAIMIQCTLRMLHAQRKYLRQRSVLICLQALVRAFTIRMRQKRQKESARRIARFYRCNRQLQQFRAFVCAAKRVKTFFMRAIYRIRYVGKKRMVSLIQNLSRGLLIRQRFCRAVLAVRAIRRIVRKYLLEKKFYRISFSAAQLIQKLFRGFSTREEQYAIVRTIKIRRALRVGTRAILRVQTMFRGKRVMSRFISIITAARRIQLWICARLCRSRFLRVLTVVRFVQSHFHRRIAARQVYSLRESLLLAEEQLVLARLRVNELHALSSLSSSPSASVIPVSLSPTRQDGTAIVPRAVSLVSNNVLSTNNLPFYQPIGSFTFGGGVTRKQEFLFDRRLLGVDISLDLSHAYPDGWLCSIARLSIEIEKSISNINLSSISCFDSPGYKRICMIATGSTHTVVVDDASNVYTFGLGENGQLGHGTASSSERKPRLIEHLSTCLLLEEGPMYSKNKGSTLLNTSTKSTTDSLTITASALGSPLHLSARALKPKNLIVKSVCCGKDHTLLLTEGGRVFSWGGNKRGQLGHSAFQSCYKPRIIGELVKTGSAKVTQIACGFYHSVCLMEPGIVYTWGAAECLGELSRSQSTLPHSDTSTSHLSSTLSPKRKAWKPPLVSSPPLSPSLHTSNDNRSITSSHLQQERAMKDIISIAGDSCVPSTPPYFQRRRVQIISSGESHVTVISGLDVLSWGQNTWGQLGRPAKEKTRFIDVAEIGNALNTETFSPMKTSKARNAGTGCELCLIPGRVQLPAMKEVDILHSTIIAGGRHTMLLTPTTLSNKKGKEEEMIQNRTVLKTLWVWGWNKYGQCGLGCSMHSILLPSAISFPHRGKLAPIRSVAAGWRHSIALMESGEVLVWGSPHLCSSSVFRTSAPDHDIASTMKSSRSMSPMSKTPKTVPETEFANSAFSSSPTSPLLVPTVVDVCTLTTDEKGSDIIEDSGVRWQSSPTRSRRTHKSPFQFSGTLSGISVVSGPTLSITFVEMIRSNLSVSSEEVSSSKKKVDGSGRRTALRPAHRKENSLLDSSRVPTSSQVDNDELQKRFKEEIKDWSHRKSRPAKTTKSNGNVKEKDSHQSSLMLTAPSSSSRLMSAGDANNPLSSDTILTLFYAPFGSSKQTSSTDRGLGCSSVGAKGKTTNKILSAFTVNSSSNNKSNPVNSNNSINNSNSRNNNSSSNNSNSSRRNDILQLDRSMGALNIQHLSSSPISTSHSTKKIEESDVFYVSIGGGVVAPISVRTDDNAFKNNSNLKNDYHKSLTSIDKKTSTSNSKHNLIGKGDSKEAAMRGGRLLHASAVRDLTSMIQSLKKEIPAAGASNGAHANGSGRRLR